MLRACRSRGSSTSTHATLRIAALAAAYGLVALPAFPSAAQAQAAQDAPARPNVLLILADDLGISDLGSYGGEINTPHLDQLADDGLLFTNAYVQPRCSPTRANLMTGQQNHAVGFDVLISGGGELRQNNVFLPEILKANGYDTYLSGKWHLGGTDNFGRVAENIPGRQNVDPRVRGFDSAFTFIDSDHSKDTWDPGQYRLLSDQVDQRTYTVEQNTNYTQGQTFYQTDAITDYAIDFIEHSRDTSDNPWFTYVAYGAPHFPLQAPKQLVDSYVSKYTAGWDAVRADRLEAMIAKGIVPSDVVLTPRSDVPGTPQAREATHQVRAWDTLSPDRQADLARRMAIYAAMVDTVDQGIGRIVDNLEAAGELDDTVIVFMSDNGGDGEWHEFGFSANEAPLVGQALQEMGTNARNDSIFYGTGWSGVSNAPYRSNKHYTHEGGIKSPMIVRWGNGLSDSLKGTMTDQLTASTDFMPTMLDLMGLELPDNWTALNGDTYAVRDFDETALSLAGFLQNGEKIENRELGWEHEGNRAYRVGDMKIVSSNFTGTDGTFANEWELYDLSLDPVEMNNLVAEQPDTFADMINKWNAWAFRNDVIDSLPMPAPKALQASANTLFVDSFSRASNADIDAETGGMGGSLVPSPLSANNVWAESHEGSGSSDSILALNGSLQLATGVGMSNAHLAHNFVDEAITEAGGMTVRLSVLEINSASSDAANRFAGFGLGMTEEEADNATDIIDGAFSYRGAVNANGTGRGNGVADFFIDLDLDGNLRVWNNGSVVNLHRGEVGHGEISVTFDVDSFDAGATVGYSVFLDGEELGDLAGSFTWDHDASNFVGLSARASNYALVDNVAIEVVPEPAALGTLTIGGSALALRRRAK